MTTNVIEPERIAIASSPWTLAGGPDPDFDDVERELVHVLLTDPGLTERYRRDDPDRPPAGYDAMVRALGYVWDCRHDHTVNATGFRCGGCGEPRGVAGR
jgi:hypothetical protein